MDSFLVILVKLTSFCRLATRCHTQMRNWPLFFWWVRDFHTRTDQKGAADTHCQRWKEVHLPVWRTILLKVLRLCVDALCILLLISILWVRALFFFFYCHFTTIIMHFVWGPALIIWKRAATEMLSAHYKYSPLRLSSRRKLIRVDQTGVQQHKDEYDNYIYD